MKISNRDIGSELKLNIKDVQVKLEKSIEKYVKGAGFSRALIGISGGVDSAVSAMLTANALGKENVLGVMMPYRTSSPKSIEDAKIVIQTAGIRSESIDITKMVDSYCESYKVTDLIRRGNIMARMRMTVLYDISMREKALVIGTSNKTETIVGYGTQYGDIACAVNPLGDLYKSQVWQLAEEIGVPKEVIDKTPTADLWEGQTDEEELGIVYSELDKLLIEMVDKQISEEELIKSGFDVSLVKKINGMIQKNQFKRKLPAIIKISK